MDAFHGGYFRNKVTHTLCKYVHMCVSLQGKCM